MRKYKAALVLMVLVLITALGAKQYSTITMGDDEWIGLASDAGRIVFDDQATDEIQFHDASVGINEDNPNDYYANNLVVSTTSGTGGITLHNATNGLGMIAFADGSVGTPRYDGAIRYDHSTQEMQFWTDYDAGPGNIDLVLDKAGSLGVKGGDLHVSDQVFIGVEEHENEDGDHMLTRADATVGYGDGGYAIYARKGIEGGAFIFFECPYEDDPGPSTILWAQWLVKDNTTGTVTEGDAVLEASSGFGDEVIIAGSGDDLLKLALARFIPGPPTKRGHLALAREGTHTYDVALLMLWVHAPE